MRFLCKLPFAVSPIIEIILQNDRRRHGVHGCFAALTARILFVIEKGLLVMIVPGFVELICRRRASPLFLLQNCK